MNPEIEGLHGCIRLLRIDIARLEVELALTQRETATVQYERAEIQLARRNVHSRTGVDPMAWYYDPASEAKEKDHG